MAQLAIIIIGLITPLRNLLVSYIHSSKVASYSVGVDLIWYVWQIKG